MLEHFVTKDTNALEVDTVELFPVQGRVVEFLKEYEACGGDLAGKEILKR